MDSLIRHTVRSRVSLPVLSMIVAGAAVLCSVCSQAAERTAAVASSASAAPHAATASPTAASPSGSEVVATPIVDVSDAWVRWLPGVLPAAGYMTLRNPSTMPLILVGADSPDYGTVMLHQTVRNGATAKMAMADALPLPPAQTVSIEPGGYHFMLGAAKHAIAPGATVILRLRFADGRTQSVSMPVSPATRTK